MVKFLFAKEKTRVRFPLSAQGNIMYLKGNVMYLIGSKLHYSDSISGSIEWFYLSTPT